MTEETIAGRIAYLKYLQEEFRRYWPYGRVRSSEPGERDSFDSAKRKIEVLTKKIEGEVL